MRRRSFSRVLVVCIAALGSVLPGAAVAGPDEDAPNPAPAGFVEALPVCDTEEPSVAAEIGGGSESTIRIGTYNVLFASGTSNESLDARVPLVIDAIAGSAADVVGVQEDELIGSRGYTSERIARGLADATGDAWSWCFFMANPLIRGTPDVYVGGGNPASDALMAPANTLGESVWRTGVGLVSRYPIVDAGAFRLPLRVAAEAEACGDDAGCFFTARFESRAALRALVDAPGGPVQVVSTHLAHGLTSLSGESRLVQTQALLGWIRAFSYRSAVPVALVGDFNSAEGTDVHAAVLEAGFLDTFRVAEPAAPGLTSGQSITAPAATVRSRIDYVFARAGSCASPLSEGTGISASEVIGDAPAAVGDGFLWPSDHYGVVTEMQPFPTEAEACPRTYTARYPAQFAASLYNLATNLGAASIEDIVRWGVDGLRLVAEQGLATPIAVPPANDGTVQVTVTWSAEDAAAIEAAASAWGLDADQFHHLGGRLVAVLVYLAIAAAQNP